MCSASIWAITAPNRHYHSFLNDTNAKEIIRVGFSGLYSHPDRPGRNIETLYEFISSVGLKEDKTAIEGRQALEQDVKLRTEGSSYLAMD